MDKIVASSPIGGQGAKLHTKAHVGFVGTVATHGFGVGHARNGSEVEVFNGFEQVPNQSLKHIQNVFLRNKRHLAVNLRELRLAVGPQVFIAETLDNLVVTVKTRHHQQLLESLRRLRQGVKLAWIHAARHHKIARAFGRRFNENGRFDFNKILCVQKRARLLGYSVAQLQVFPNHVAAQV